MGKLFSLCLMMVIAAFAVNATSEGTVTEQALQANDVKKTPDAMSDLKGLDTFFDAAIDTQMKALDIPAVTVSVVKGGKLIFARGYGTTDIEKQLPVTAEATLFRVGSTSKLFTWTAVMQQVEEGKLDLNADVNTYLRNFQIPATHAEPITLIHLLTHTAGFEEGALGYLLGFDPALIKPLRESLEKYMPRRINKPGAYSSYSNYSTALAGLIVENVSSIPFNSYIKQSILDPLGMTSSSFDEPLPDPLNANMAIGYKREMGVYKAKEFEIISNFGPAGALSSTSTDMAKFMLAHLNDGRLGDARILQPETAKLMHSRLFAPDERISGMAHGFYEAFKNGHRLINHGGDTTLFHSNLVLNKQENLGIFVSYMGLKDG